MFIFPIDVFEAFVRKANEHGIQDHPGVKAIVAVGGLVAEVGCDVKLDGSYLLKNYRREKGQLNIYLFIPPPITKGEQSKTKLLMAVEDAVTKVI